MPLALQHFGRPAGRDTLTAGDVFVARFGAEILICLAIKAEEESHYCVVLGGVNVTDPPPSILAMQNVPEIVEVIDQTVVVRPLEEQGKPFMVPEAQAPSSGYLVMSTSHPPGILIGGRQGQPHLITLEGEFARYRPDSAIFYSSWALVIHHLGSEIELVRHPTVLRQR